MKTIKIKKSVVSVVAILMMVVMAFPVSVKADNSSSSNGKGKAVLVGKVGDSQKKRVPSKNVLVLQYSDGLLSLSSEYYEAEFTITFENCDTLESYELPSIAVGESVFFVLPNGEYNVTAVDSDGRVFSGTLIL